MCISQHTCIRFAIVRSYVDGLNARNKGLIVKLLKQGYRYLMLSKVFSKFYRRHHDLVSKFNVGLKSLFLHQGLSKPQIYGDLEFYGDLTELVNHYANRSLCFSCT